MEEINKDRTRLLDIFHLYIMLSIIKEFDRKKDKRQIIRIVSITYIICHVFIQNIYFVKVVIKKGACVYRIGSLDKIEWHHYAHFHPSDNLIFPGWKGIWKKNLDWTKHGKISSRKNLPASFELKNCCSPVYEEHAVAKREWSDHWNKEFISWYLLIVFFLECLCLSVKEHLPIIDKDCKLPLCDGQINISHKMTHCWCKKWIRIRDVNCYLLLHGVDDK